jgi:dTDP-4-dehydrorhamnose reductase
MKILITGASGLLGSNLTMLGSRKHTIWATYHSHPVAIPGCELIPLDLTDAEAVWKSVDRIQPEAVVHTAALANVDYCETHPEEAWEVNVAATETLAQAIAGLDCKLVYISTDYVFDGVVGMYTEDDEPNPLNHYAYTKLKGEEVVAGCTTDHLIIRTSIYGWNIQDKFSFAEWILDRLARGQRVPIVSDQYFTPILVNHLARAIFDMLESGAGGLYHVAGVERCSKLSFARTIARVFGCDPQFLDPVTTASLALKAARPLDPSLDVSKARTGLHMRLPDVEEGIVEMKALRSKGYVRILKRGISSC